MYNLRVVLVQVEKAPGYVFKHGFIVSKPREYFGLFLANRRGSHPVSPSATQGVGNWEGNIHPGLT